MAMRACLCSLLACLLGACGDGGDSSTGIGRGPASSGQDPFNDAVLTTLDLQISPADWSAMVNDPFDDTWRRSTVVWEGETWPDVAVRPSGEITRVPGNPKPSLRLEFDEFVPRREFHGHENLKLDALINDPTFMRERLAYAAYAARGVPAPRVAPVRLRVNGVYNGLYQFEERVNKDFLVRRFGAFRQLYDWTRVGNDFDWRGSNPLLYVPDMMAPKIESLSPDAEHVRDLVDRFHHFPYAEVAAWLDVENFLNFIAVELLLGEGDAYVGGIYEPGGPPVDFRSGNFYLSRSASTGLYFFIAWDRDQSYWRVQSDVFTGFSDRLLTRRLILEVPANRDRHLAILRELIDGPHATGLQLSRVDSMRAQIEAAVREDPHYTRTDEQFGWEVEGLKDYIRARNQSLRAQLGP